MSANSKNERPKSNQQAQIDENVKRIVVAAPPIDVAMRDRLALLLRGAGVTS